MNLAGAYQQAGRLNEAIPLYEQTLAKSTAVLGDRRPHTLTSGVGRRRAFVVKLVGLFGLFKVGWHVLG